MKYSVVAAMGCLLSLCLEPRPIPSVSISAVSDLKHHVHSCNTTASKVSN